MFGIYWGMNILPWSKWRIFKGQVTSSVNSLFEENNIRVCLLPLTLQLFPNNSMPYGFEDMVASPVCSKLHQIHPSLKLMFNVADVHRPCGLLQTIFFLTDYS